MALGFSGSTKRMGTSLVHTQWLLPVHIGWNSNMVLSKNWHGKSSMKLAAPATASMSLRLSKDLMANVGWLTKLVRIMARLACV